MHLESEFMTLVGDNPIREPSEDRLGRAHLAASFAQQILRTDVSEGLVVGVVGPWGSGKTSFVNLMRHRLESEDVPVLDFNPWLFSGSEHLVQAFFSQLKTHFRTVPGLARIGTMLYKYGDHVSAVPFVGPWAARAKLVIKLLWRQRQDSPIEAARNKISKKLKQRTRPIIVVLDDLDRLTTSEIRDIFRLVRLTASFPNVVYVLAFDRYQIERALSLDDSVPPLDDPAGRAYLEKIVQVVLNLPEISQEVLLDELAAALDRTLSGVADLELPDEHRWGDVLIHIIRPLVKNVRDVRRYCASVRGTVTGIAGDICLPDILALEAVRIFLPDVFTQLLDHADGITSPLVPRVEAPSATEDARLSVTGIIESGGRHRGAVESLLRDVFPEGGRHLASMIAVSGSSRDWYRQRRVANTEIFRLYLERCEGQTLGSQRRSDHALSLMTDPEALQSYLRSLAPESLRHVISLLETHEGHYLPDQVIPGVTVLLNILPTMPEHRGGFFDLDNRMVVMRVVLRLLRALRTSEDVSAAVDAIMPQVETLSAQLELILFVGHKESIGSGLVSEQDAVRFESSFRDRVRTTTPDALAREPKLLSVILEVKRDASDSEPDVLVSLDPRVTRSILESSKYEVRTEPAVGPVQHTPRLSWDALIEVYGDETVLGERIGELRSQNFEGIADLLELAERYQRGWRPREWPGGD